MCIGPFGAKPVIVVFIGGAPIEQLIICVEGRVEPRCVVQERGIEPGRDGDRRGRGGRHGAGARAPGAAPRAPATALRSRLALAAPRAPLTGRHETIQLGSRF